VIALCGSIKIREKRVVFPISGWLLCETRNKEKEKKDIPLII
jgi:hypothetical protein